MFFGAVILLGKFMILFMDTGKKKNREGGPGRPRGGSGVAHCIEGYSGLLSMIMPSLVFI